MSRWLWTWLSMVCRRFCRCPGRTWVDLSTHSCFWCVSLKSRKQWECVLFLQGIGPLSRYCWCRILFVRMHPLWCWDDLAGGSTWSDIHPRPVNGRFEEIKLSRSTSYSRDIVEADTAQFGAHKKGLTCKFDGRTLVLQSRKNKAWTVFPLKAKSTTGKRGGGGPESKKEVKPILKSHLKKGCVLAADGSTAFQSSAKDLQMCSLKGVSHLKK